MNIQYYRVILYLFFPVSFCCSFFFITSSLSAVEEEIELNTIKIGLSPERQKPATNIISSLIARSRSSQNLNDAQTNTYHVFKSIEDPQIFEFTFYPSISPTIQPPLLIDHIPGLHTIKFGKLALYHLLRFSLFYMGHNTLKRFESAGLYTPQISRFGDTDYHPQTWYDEFIWYFPVILYGIKSTILQGLLDPTFMPLINRVFSKFPLFAKYIAPPLLKTVLGTTVHAFSGILVRWLSKLYRGDQEPIFHWEYLIGWLMQLPAHLIFGVGTENFIHFLHGWSWKHITWPIVFKLATWFSISLSSTPVLIGVRILQIAVWFVISYGLFRLSDALHHWLFNVDFATPENPPNIAGNRCRIKDALWYGMTSNFWRSPCEEKQIILGKDAVWFNNTPIDIEGLMHFTHFNGTMHEFILEHEFFGHIFLPRGIHENASSSFVFYNQSSEYKVIFSD